MSEENKQQQQQQKEEEEYVPGSILLTGGAGFIGSNVLVHLVKTYPNTPVVCLDCLDYCSSINNMNEIKDCDNFTFVKGDIRSSDLVNHIIAAYKIDTILHFAAQTHVDNSFGNSFQFTNTNVFGTHVLLEAAKLFKKQVRRFIHVSTDEVYGESSLDPDDSGFHERSALNPSNPYAATKAAAEFMVKAYKASFGLPTIITRGNNVYGPHQFPEKLIPKFINLLERGKSCPVHGSGENYRSFLYVHDVARAFEFVVKKGQVGEIYNIGTKFEISNIEVARKLLKQFGYENEEDKYLDFVPDRNFNDVRYNISHEKLEKLGWKPLVDFDEGLKLTIEWYRTHKNHFGDITGALVAHPRFNMGKANKPEHFFFHKDKDAKNKSKNAAAAAADAAEE
eukprot:TRINITY_DN66820_c8_g2_i1.p1 TRINITY_DN66820_c8_g2~~TRINITY_DN66820_c8_g2_i1.p1  ORF type:complete len:394 (-),score=243.94 TRINITY_DN66820_c8_g2_i1:209-1390(-)